ncbi:MAG TPA: hypothetical protein EYO33_07325 [Phycisphaerales bacterium]|nr:hypothetical protein [Phycisphaerales bacterium]
MQVCYNIQVRRLFEPPPVQRTVEALKTRTNKNNSNSKADWLWFVAPRKEVITLYKQGDTVSHAYHGIGTVKAIGEKEFLGETNEFATLYFPHEELRLSILKKDIDEHVRDIITEAEAHEIIEYLSSYDEKLAKNWKRRNHNNKERLTSGDPREICIVAKGLMELKYRRKKPLSNSDRRQLQRALRLLAEELGRVLDEEAEIMEEKLREACLDSLAA